MSEKNVEKKSHGIGTWFREMKSELKKVVWPSGKQVYKNTIVVLAVCALFAAITFVMDFALTEGVTLLQGIGR